MKLRRKISTIAAVLLACGMLTACSLGGNKGEGAQNADHGEDTIKLTAILDSSAVLTNFDSPEEALEAYENNISTGQIQDTAQNRATKENLLLLKDFADQNKVELTSVDWGWGDTLTQKLSASFLAKEGPDIIIGETQMPGFAKQGYLEPFPEELAQKIRQNLNAASWKSMEYEGKLYGVALEPSSAILVWNKNILKESGLDPEKAPETWDELLQNMETVYKGGTYSGGGIYAGSNNGGYLRFGAFLRGAGGWFVDEKGQPDINNSANLPAFELLRKMNSFNKPGIVTASEEGTFFSAFDKGRLAYKVDGQWAINQAKLQGLDCGYSMLPSGPGGEASGIVLGAGYQAVPVYSSNKEIAFKLIELMIDSEFQKNIADGGIRIPAQKSVASSDEYKKAQPELYSMASTLDRNITGLPTFSGNAAKAWAEIGTAMSKTMQTSDDIKTIADDAQKSLLEAASEK